MTTVEKAIQNHIKKYGGTEQGVKSCIWKIQDRFYRYDISDKEALAILRKYYKSGWGSLDAYLRGEISINILGYKKFYSI